MMNIPIDKPSFIVHADYEKYFDLLEDSNEKVIWMKAVFAFQNSKSFAELENKMLPGTRMFWEFTKANFYRELENWKKEKAQKEEWREKKRLQKEKERQSKPKEHIGLSQGVATGRQVSPSVAKGRKVSPSVTRGNVNVKDNVNININGNENENVVVKGNAIPTDDDKILKFQNAFPKKLINAEFAEKYDIDLLIQKINESKKWLANEKYNHLTPLSWLLSNYENILADKYKDGGKVSSTIKNDFFKGRDYSGTDLNNLYDDIDDIEV